jgi:di/tricarboxylate transporter
LTGAALYVLAVVVVALVLWVLETLPVELVSMLAVLALAVGGVITPDEALRGFGNSALITVACMFVLSAGLIRTGALDFVTGFMLDVGKGSKARSIGALMLAVAFISAFMNNTPVAVIFLPIVLSVAYRLEVAPSRLLIPLSYATILGGTCTLIGTSTNLLVSQAVEKAGRPALGMFEFAGAGVIYAVTGLAFLAIAGPLLLPRRASVTSNVAGGRVREFVTEVLFPPGSALVGRSFQEVVGRVQGIEPLMVIRGDETHPAPLISNPRTQFVRSGDVLLLKGAPGGLNELLSRDGVTLTPELGAALAGHGKGKAMTMVELVVNPNSPLIGRTLGGAQFSRHHGNASVIAILRRDEHLRERVSEIRMRMGDTLLALCDEERLDELRNTDEFVMLEGVERQVVRRRKAPLAAAILALVVVLAALEVMPMSFLALAGAVAMVLTGCLTLRQSYAAIDASVIVLIAGTLAMGLAMEKSGAIDAISQAMLGVLQGWGPRAVLAGIFLLATVINALISNNAVAVLFTPIAISIARTLGLQPEPFIFAVLFGASCDYSTPIGYQTNLFVYGPGGYRFSDYVRIGVPLTLVLFAVSMLVIPWLWPFTAVIPAHP